MSQSLCKTCSRTNCADSDSTGQLLNCSSCIEDKPLKGWEDKKMEPGLSDSGERQIYSSGMMREPSDIRARFDLILPETQPYDTTLLYRWASILAMGAKKYEARNFEKANSVEELERFKSSAWRHFIKLMSGETDEMHDACLVFNINGIIYLMDKLKVDIHGNPVCETK